jgi:hypothetical protein
MFRLCHLLLVRCAYWKLKCTWSLFTPFRFKYFYLTPVANFNLPSLISGLPPFVWMRCFYYANPLFLMGISFSIYSFFIYAHFFKNVTMT